MPDSPRCALAGHGPALPDPVCAARKQKLAALRARRAWPGATRSGFRCAETETCRAARSPGMARRYPIRFALRGNRNLPRCALAGHGPALPDPVSAEQKQKLAALRARRAWPGATRSSFR